MMANESRIGGEKKETARLYKSGPRQAVRQTPHLQRLWEQDIGRAKPNGSINPINPRHMPPRGSAPNPASIIIVLRYYHYSVFPLCGFAFNPLVEGKECEKKEKRSCIRFERARKTDVFSQGRWSRKMPRAALTADRSHGHQCNRIEDVENGLEIKVPQCRWVFKACCSC